GVRILDCLTGHNVMLEYMDIFDISFNEMLKIFIDSLKNRDDNLSKLGFRSPFLRGPIVIYKFIEKYLRYILIYKSLRKPVESDLIYPSFQDYIIDADIQDYMKDGKLIDYTPGMSIEYKFYKSEVDQCDEDIALFTKISVFPYTQQTYKNKSNK